MVKPQQVTLWSHKILYMSIHSTHWEKVFLYKCSFPYSGKQSWSHLTKCSALHRKHLWKRQMHIFDCEFCHSKITGKKILSSESPACNVQFKFPSLDSLWNHKPQDWSHLRKDISIINRVLLYHYGSRHWEEKLKNVSLGQVAFMVLHAKADCTLEGSTWECDKFSHLHPESKSVILGRKLSCFQSLLCVFAGLFFRFCLLIVCCSFLGCDSFTGKGLMMCPQPILKQLWPLLPVIDVSAYYLSGHCRWNRVYRV